MESDNQKSSSTLSGKPLILMLMLILVLLCTVILVVNCTNLEVNKQVSYDAEKIVGLVEKLVNLSHHQIQNIKDNGEEQISELNKKRKRLEIFLKDTK